MAIVIFVIFEKKKLKVKPPLQSKKWNMWNMTALIMMASPVTLRNVTKVHELSRLLYDLLDEKMGIQLGRTRPNREIF